MQEEDEEKLALENKRLKNQVGHHRLGTGTAAAAGMFSDSSDEEKPEAVSMHGTAKSKNQHQYCIMLLLPVRLACVRACLRACVFWLLARDVSVGVS